MSGQIRMSPAELKDKAKRYIQSSQQIDQILKDLSTLQEQLHGEWEGLAFNKFNDQFIQLKPKVQDFSHLMLEINEQLTKTADAMAQQDEALSRNFGLS